MHIQLTDQHTLTLETPDPPKPKRRQDRSRVRKPSARAAFRLEEIPIVAEQMTGTYALRDQLLFR